MHVSAIDTQALPPAVPRPARALRPDVVADRLDDESLASLVADGGEPAFTALYDRYSQPLYRYCRSLLHNDADAQDALQSAFTSALTALRQDRRDAPLRPWLFRIAHNEAISLVRRRHTGEPLSESMLPPVESAADQAAERARLALLVADLNQLPERQRGALLMRELSGLSHAEIALALATSPAAAKQAIFEARAALSEFADGRAAPCEEIRRRLSEHDGRVLRSRRLRSHLRDCASCDAFAAAIAQRRSDLRAIAPALPFVASVGLLARIGRSGGDQGVSGLAAGGAAAGAATKFGGAAVISKSLAAIAAAVTAVAGVAGLGPTRHSTSAAGGPQAKAVPHTTTPAAHAAATGSRLRWRASAHQQPTHRSARVANRPATSTRAGGRSATNSGSARGSASTGSQTAGKRPVKLAQNSGRTTSSQAGVTQTQTSNTTSTPTSQSASSPGNSSAAPGHGGTSPGNSGSSNGNSGTVPGRTGATSGNGGTPPGQAKTPPGPDQNFPGADQNAPRPGQQRSRATRCNPITECRPTRQQRRCGRTRGHPAWPSQEVGPDFPDLCA
jgi:RNA polymerase sigma factor (sigma-70 family)